MAELRVGDPAELATDVGPLIDDEAHANLDLERTCERLQAQRAPCSARNPGRQPRFPRLLAPVAFEIARRG